MKRSIIMFGVLLLGCVLVFSAVVISAEAQNGDALVQERCTQCHNLDRVHRRAGQDMPWWERTVDRMIGKRSGLLNSPERDAVLEYLTRM
ncbi:hypothetical protein SAMN05660653_02320 [Desulfonatronum thiosulfatophilum]|uniref:Quinohemoprotein amine dehydrogenase alpha subunit haem binding domain-containing protein n=1 Tax=Desulfonatronum thiosulfatophilum TaxID=617002 RepID=A0A1G6DQJ3_9BACT|nr:hypothetical protein [Desulfonatronum thiosulfatophilum]SDB47408.1 hypothetical protein SAMN05660653_02320 [Desulfonatronum thiosulfatophilum]